MHEVFLLNMVVIMVGMCAVFEQVGMCAVFE
jgi:hypothetical protein